MNLFFKSAFKKIFIYVAYMENERLQGEEQLRTKNYLLEISCSHSKIRLKIAPQELNFVMAKAI